ncbi:hypothetical protein HDV05_001615 [Chytridiales sp. JEL 0842]|nr:hypothetical protein HDV05_001615 [Chytridiales sp. JEL 0842]
MLIHALPIFKEIEHLSTLSVQDLAAAVFYLPFRPAHQGSEGSSLTELSNTTTTTPSQRARSDMLSGSLQLSAPPLRLDLPESLHSHSNDFLRGTLYTPTTIPYALSTYHPSSQLLLTVLTFGPAVTGHPSTLHGGLTATLFDDFMGALFFLRGRGEYSGFTGRLEVDYRVPLKLVSTTEERVGTVAVVGVWIEKVERRKVWIRGELWSLPSTTTSSSSSSSFSDDGRKGRAAAVEAPDGFEKGSVRRRLWEIMSSGGRGVKHAESKSLYVVPREQYEEFVAKVPTNPLLIPSIQNLPMSSLPHLALILLPTPPPTPNLDPTSPPPSTLANEYGKKESTSSVVHALQEAGVRKVIVLDVSLQTVEAVLKDVQQIWETTKREDPNGPRHPVVVVNLCDGTEADGYPGLSVVQGLEDLRIPYTGSPPNFYTTTTSKTHLKRHLLASSVPTSPFWILDPHPNPQHQISEAAEKLHWPMFVKPSVSYASLGVSDSSVVHSSHETQAQVLKLKKEFEAMQTDPGEIYVEAFLKGREFTALVVGRGVGGVRCFPVVERVFDEELRVEERVLGFERYWEGYTLESKDSAKDLDGGVDKKEGKGLYWYELAPESWQEVLQDVARRAYIACGGASYGRVDLRTSDPDNPATVQVLEVNAQCGLSFGKGTSSLGEILELAGVTGGEFMRGLVEEAVESASNAQVKERASVN